MAGHWAGVIDAPILDVAYEALVEDPEGHARRLVEFAGLPWDDACARPHESDRVTLTASSEQVREPVYRSSSGRWKNYERHLGPLASLA